MKKFSILIFICVLGLASTSRAQTDPDGEEITSWFAQINAASNFPSGHLAQDAGQGWGGEAAFGFRLPGHVELSVQSGYDTFNSKSTLFNGTWNMIPLVVKGQVYFGQGNIRPYVFLAAGLAFNSESASFLGITGTNSETDFLEEGGIGLAFPMGNRSSFFIQGKVDVDNTSSAYASDQPTVFFPVSAGFQFMLN
jgi:hypothetical protein